MTCILDFNLAITSTDKFRDGDVMFLYLPIIILTVNHRFYHYYSLLLVTMFHKSNNLLLHLNMCMY